MILMDMRKDIMNDKDYIRLPKQLQDSLFWESDTPFDCRSALIDLLLSTNCEDEETIYGSNFVVRRGQELTSIRRLSERWHWSKDRVERFLNELVAVGWIQKEITPSGTLLTIVDYEQYVERTDAKKIPVVKL